MSVVDTNVLVHSSVTASPDHGRARAALARLRSEGPVAVTRQILREFLSATTRPQPWAVAATLTEATQNTDGFLQRFAVLEDGPRVWDELMSLTRAPACRRTQRPISRPPCWRTARRAC